MSTSHIGLTPYKSSCSRCLPSRAVTDETIAEAYAAFILYCNPAIPAETDTLDLKTLFRTPPKSDGKSFNIFVLYELICKLESKEIKTWAELALELGVEPPDLAKHQSPQKVQQYAVRLKRWMHAMHVDVFFEYLREKDHPYFTKIPTPDNLVPEERDGVPNEEDLALRALLPETRPKRGRKRAEEKEPDQSGETCNIARRRRVNSHGTAEAVNDINSRESPEDDPVAAVDATTKMLKAKLEAWASDNSGLLPERQHRASAPEISTAPEFHPDRRLTHPVYRHPTSGSPKNHDSFSPPMGESIDSSETTPRPRRKTGTIVSSAWRSSSATEGSKLRGRPPSNRNMSDGPYTTFPVIPELRTSATAPSIESPSLSSNVPTPRPELWSSAVGNWGNSSMGIGGNGPLSDKLKLPPPIPDRPLGSPHNYQIAPSMPMNTPSPSSYMSPAMNYGPPQWNPRPMTNSRQPSIPTSYYAADESVSNESPVTTSSSAPSSRPLLETQDNTNVEAIELSYMQSILGAEWFDILGNPTSTPDPVEAQRLCQAIVKCQRTETRDDNTFLINLATMAGCRLLSKRLRIYRAGETGTHTIYRTHWQMQYGSTQGWIEIKCDVPKSDFQARRDSLLDGLVAPEDPDELESSGAQVDWKRKYVELHQVVLERTQTLEKFKKTVLDGVLQAKDRM